MKRVIKNQRSSTIFLILIVLATSYMTFGQSGIHADTPEVDNLLTVEGYVTGISPGEYYTFNIEFHINGEFKTASCAPSTTFNVLYEEDYISDGTKVLALVDIETLTGTVFDAVETYEPEEPVPEPEPEPEPELVLPDGVELVSCDPSPNPDYVAPEGKVKLTMLIHPGEVEGITTNIPPGVYYVDKGLKILYTCTSENPSWEFEYWNIGMGALGSTKKSGVGCEHYLRLTMDTDIVLMAFHKEKI